MNALEKKEKNKLIESSIEFTRFYISLLLYGECEEVKLILDKGI